MIYDFQALAEVFSHVPDSAPAMLAETIKQHPRIFLFGAGRSGLMIKAFAMRLAQTGRTVYVVGETVTPAISEKDLLILASASGKTPSVIRCAQTAREIGTSICTLTAVPDSPLTHLSDTLICLPAPTKDSTVPSSAPMGTLFEQALLLFCDQAVLALHEDRAKMRRFHANLE